MIKKSVYPFSAKITLGLETGYEKTVIEKSAVTKFIQKIQNELIKN